MARVIIGEDHDWANTAMARRRAVANSLRSAEVQERKQANRIKDRRAKDRQQAENRRLATQGARFSAETHRRLQSAIRRTAEATRGATPDLDAALVILGRTLDTGETDSVAILPSPEDARTLVKALRSPGVDGFCVALEQLEVIAETPEPETPGFNLHTAAFFAALRLVERDDHHVPSRVIGSRFNAPKITDGTIYSVLSDTKDPKRFEAAAILRQVVIRRGHPQLHLSPEEAILLSEVLTALGADRAFLSSVNRIAALAPAAAA